MFIRRVLMILTVTLTLFSCEKENVKKETTEVINDVEIPNPYGLPWKTEFIHYENTFMCRGNHSSGYKLYYKDSLLKEECIEFGGIGVSDSLLINDSIVHLFFSGSAGSHILTTSNGGYSWDRFGTGPPFLQELHFVSEKLTYCVTKNQNDLYFTGIGASDLATYHNSLNNGINYISDFGTEITNIDSTIIEINDSVDFVILFR